MKKKLINIASFLPSFIFNIGGAVLLFFVFANSLSSCNDHEQEVDAYEKILGGKHELRKFNVRTETSTVTHGSYFLLMGSYSSQDVTDTRVRFYFKNHRDEYQFMELRLDDVNIKTDSTVVEPYVKFFWSDNGHSEDEWRRMYDWDVTGAVIYCKEEDFQPEININDLR